ncbi:hypothetical protein [Maribacter arenosus]|uniref:Uncharacterized protein n=1 Tax=Maribacter arenosus TaxID=1854708 RepID=A0ABR7VH73_9FLAO|nr:hypothetical protein [Maribacter arenosus]MBD0851507.1 hypothetical protein [Maribacter arenosus]
MRKFIFITTFLCCLGWVKAQEDVPLIDKGTVLILGEPSSGINYQHIHFPKRNFILKRGGIADFKQLIGEKVEVHQIEYAGTDKTKIVLKRKDGRRFFRFFPNVKADFEKALALGELKLE